MYGQDANWGRVAAAVGRSGAALSENKLSIWFDNEKIFANGSPTGANEGVLKDILSKDEVKITIDIGLGKHAITMWTCDLSEEYIRINAKYRT
jgi:glutamate N-acetyltransferase/amino-acid N-acetyltransferase